MYWFVGVKAKPNILKKDTRIAKKLQTGVEPNLFGIMVCVSIYNVVKSTPLNLECSRVIWNIH